MLGYSTKNSFLAATCIFTIIFASATIADSLYLIERGNTGSEDALIRVDPDSQQAETIGLLEFNYRFGSMVWHPEKQQLLVVNTRPRDTDTDPTLTDFYWVDPSTAASQDRKSVV